MSSIFFLNGLGDEGVLVARLLGANQSILLVLSTQIGMVRMFGPHNTGGSTTLVVLSVLGAGSYFPVISILNGDCMTLVRVGFGCCLLLRQSGIRAINVKLV